MGVNDPIGDMITRIRNAQMRAKSKVSMPGSKQRERVCEVLKTEGYIRGYAAVAHADGRSVYASVKALPRINNGLGISILSTPKGVMADHAARDANVGGEIICTVF